MLKQPRDVLRPTAFTIEAAEQWALSRSAKLPKEPFRLTALWSISFIRQPTPHERKTHYVMRLAQSQNYGLCTQVGGPFPRSVRAADIIGLDTRLILKKELYANRVDRTALVDLVMGHISRPADETIRLDSPFLGKYQARAEIFAREAKRILRRKDLKDLKGRPCALVVGATAGVIRRLAQEGFRILATDLSPKVLGQRLGGIKVQRGEANARGMTEADVAIITGMTLPNRTLAGLVELAKRHNTSTIIWAITGRNCGDYYTQHGIDCVISDPSPFLLLPGPANMAIWRRSSVGEK